MNTNNTYLSTWFRNFPNLRTILTKEDKEILSRIDPAEYALHNLTQDAEVLYLIRTHRPSAWVWERLYPNLKNLSPEDREILNQIYPAQYVDELTESDIRSIIEYRKSKRKTEIDKSREKKAREYYEQHKEEIEAENKSRDRATSVAKWSIPIGVALLSGGIATHLPVVAAIGLITTVAGPIKGINRTKEIDDNSVAPKKQEEKVKLGVSGVLFVVAYYMLLIGIGLLLGGIIPWAKLGWYHAMKLLSAGATIAGVAAITVLLAIIVTTTSKE